jgi:hypothetical protein
LNVFKAASSPRGLSNVALVVSDDPTVQSDNPIGVKLFDFL